MDHRTEDVVHRLEFVSGYGRQDVIELTEEVGELSAECGLV